MNKSESVAKLAEALSKAQAEFTHAPLNSTNPFLKNKYADLGSVIQSVRPAMTKNGLAITQTVAAENGIVTVETMLMHASGEWITQSIGIPVDQSKGMSLAQSIGAVVTYLRRYSIAAIMGIYADEDTDGNDEKTTVKQSKPAPAPQPAPAPTMIEAGQSLATGMPLDEAKAVKNTEGVAYGDIATDKLSHMLNAMTKGVRENKYKDGDLDAVLNKIEAAKAIIASRQ